MIKKISEHEIQKEYFRLLKSEEHKHPAIPYIFSIPNGGARHIKVAMKMKAEGVKRGVPDIFIPYVVGGFGGAWIETKTQDGRLSPHQKEYKKFLETQYKHYLCRSVTEMFEATENYLKIKLLF